MFKKAVIFLPLCLYLTSVHAYRIVDNEKLKSTNDMVHYKESLPLPHQLPIDLLQPTGKWYIKLLSKEEQPSDSCGNFNTFINKKYDHLFESFEEAKEYFLNLIQLKYTEKECSFLEEQAYDETPDDLPIIASDYLDKTWYPFEYFTDHTGTPKTTTLYYKCIDKDGIKNYSDFKIYPEYQCLDGTCNSTQPACNMDVYGRNLNSSGGKWLGHVGFVTSVGNNDAKILEVLQDPPIIHFHKRLSHELSDGPIWGIRYGYGKATRNGDMTFGEALDMETYGFIQMYFCPQYTLLPKYEEGDYDHCAEFRCDTFVKYLFNKYLNTDLPPYHINDAPKDLFNAFINQRGEIANPAYQNIKANYSQSVVNTSNNTWDDYLDAKSTDNKLKALDGLYNIDEIPYSKLLDSVKKTKDSEIKSKLLFIIFKKASALKPNLQEKNDIKTILENLVNHSRDAKIISNSILVAHKVLDSNEFYHYLNLVIDSIPTLEKENRRFITNTILHISYQSIILNGNLPDDFNKIINRLRRDDIAIVYSIHIIKTPKNKLKKPKKYLLQVINNHKKQKASAINYNYFLNYHNKFIKEALNKLDV